jgi:hypothetical protein
MRPILVLSCAVVISSAMLLHSWGADERGFSICEEFDLSYFPEPASERALLALALMREGRGPQRAGTNGRRHARLVCFASSRARGDASGAAEFLWGGGLSKAVPWSRRARLLAGVRSASSSLMATTCGGTRSRCARRRSRASSGGVAPGLRFNEKRSA